MNAMSTPSEQLQQDVRAAVEEMLHLVRVSATARIEARSGFDRYEHTSDSSSLLIAQRKLNEANSP